MTRDASDYQAIQSLLTKYCYVVDWSSIDDIMTIFHPDVTLLPHYEGDQIYQGSAAARAWFVGYLQNTRAPKRAVRHKLFPAHIDMNRDEPVSSMWFDSESIWPDNNIIKTVVGRYDDKFARHEGRWLIKEHRIVAYYARQTEGYTIIRDSPQPYVSQA